MSLFSHASLVGAAFVSGLAGLSLAGSAGAAEAVGQVVKVAGAVFAQGGGPKRALAAGADLAARETVTTDATGRAVLQIGDRTIVSLGGGASLTLEGSMAGSAVVVRVPRGVLRAAASFADPDAFKIEAPVATLGLGRAQADVQLEEDLVRVTVLDGGVIACPRKGRPAFADCVEVTAGQTVTVVATRADVVASGSVPPLRADLLPLAGSTTTLSPVQAIGGAAKVVGGVAGAVNSVTTKVLGTTGKLGGAVLNGTVGEVARPLSGADPDEPVLTQQRPEH